ncbi:MAG TPA: muconolactone Delta-isomerase family protein [Edaphobacter sp.]|jgi:muconolactone delta-isomerase|nr:muconolactone Delta-isomerase family protein [Edaphobacter sp.]
MQFLVLTERFTDKFPAEAWKPELIAAEGQRVRELYAAGLLRSAWRRKDKPGAALILEADTEAAVREAIETLPLFQLGMIGFPLVTQLEPYPGFGPR